MRDAPVALFDPKKLDGATQILLTPPCLDFYARYPQPEILGIKWSSGANAILTGPAPERDL